jgi:hypothetical protein
LERTDETMGTVELTGLEMTRMCALGETREMEAARSRTMLALVWESVRMCASGMCGGTYVEQVVTGHLGMISGERSWMSMNGADLLRAAQQQIFSE